MHPGRSLRRRAVRCALVAGLASLVACTGGGEPGDEPRGSTLDRAAVAEAAQRLAAAAFTDPGSLSAVNEVRFTPEGAEAAAQSLERGATGDELWAAVWVYGTSGGDPAPLLPALKDADASIRIMAAAAVLARGELAGFEVLATELENTEPLAGSEPPRAVWEFALTTLERYTNERPIDVPADVTDPGLLGLREAWSAWLDANEAALAFDRGSGTWSTP